MDLTYGHWEIKKKKKEEMLELRIDSLTLNSGRLQGGSLKRPNGLRYNREMKFFFFFLATRNHN